ncbi:MAG: Y-family DNA polymerase [Candidatus Marinimicrobia bacterium]|nr:Y-family DNA polymerase [Candidatus Neomarinimicrobiota bacterium]MBL7023411.1 Y-family DNA polymerase [Candidatus Neomarinimicrobiota bacterium]MBL7108840.1 Y-family DNA polymerase [Candidatus Neomarinimicrobiota bacterium]
MFALVDCNNFYASCERVFHPRLNHKPIIVLSNNDGCVIARSNEAKALGIKMGEPAFKIKQFLKDNNVAVFSSNYALYGDMSRRVMNILWKLSQEMEIYSIDEAFLDLSGFNDRQLFEFGQTIRNTIKQHTGIPVSVGVASTKTLSKVANHIAKKHKRDIGVFLMNENKTIERVLKHFPVEDIWGIGRQYANFLKSHNIHTALELKNTSENWVRKHLTVMGTRIIKELDGTSCIPMESVTPSKKAICTSRSFGVMVEDIAQLRESISMYATRCAEKLRKQKSCAGIINVFIQTNRFKPELPQYNNGKIIKLQVPSDSTSELIYHSVRGLEAIYKPGYNYKKAGVIVTNIVPSSQVQQSLFDKMDRATDQQITKTIDVINSRMGRDVIRYAVQGFNRKWKLRQEQLSPCYTTRWNDLLTINTG